MSDVYTQFLDEMEEAGSEFDSKTGGIGTVARMKIEFGFHYYNDTYGSEYWKFWRCYKTPQDTQAAYSSAKEAMELAEEDFKLLQNGLKVTVFSEGILAGNAKIDLSKFCALWKDTGKLILESARKENLPINDIFYGQMKYTSDPYFVGMGEDGKTKEYDGKMMFPTFMLPVQKFANEQEAVAFVEANSKPESDSNGYSAKAMAEFNDVTVLEMNGAEILATYDNALNGQQYMKIELPDAPVPFNLPEYEIILKKYTADIWKIESSDIDLLQKTKPDIIAESEIPF